MIKDIVFPEVEDVAIAVVQEHEGLDEYAVYLINLKMVAIKNVLVVCSGYGTVDDQQVKTSTMRHFFEEVKSHDYMKIELIQKEVFGLNNEYWLSFSLNNQLFDKRFVFLPETIIESNFIHIPIIDKKGVLIK